MVKFLGNISYLEKLNFNKQSLCLIQKLYKSDIRSMINFMQSNQNIKAEDINIIDDTVWDSLYNKIKKGTELNSLIKLVNEISITYNIDKKNIIKDFLNYIIRNHQNINTPEYLNFVENIIHFEDCKNSYYVNYSLSKLVSLLKEL
jgi:replication factor C subunit 3/5